MLEDIELDKDIILESINELSEGIPIEWDRIVEGKYYFIVFGWIPNIKRDDFVAIIFLEDYSFYFTSSVKYTEKMSENWNCIEKHSDCIKFKEYFGEQLEGI